MEKFSLNEVAFKAFVPDEKNVKMRDFMSEYVYTSFYLYKIENLTWKSSNDLEAKELVNSFCTYLLGWQKLYSKGIIEYSNEWFFLYIFPFILEKKEKYRDSRFIDIYNRYFAIGNFKGYKKYLFVFSDVKHTKIKEFFKIKESDNFKRIEIEELNAKYVNDLLLSEGTAEQFILNQFKVEFPFMYLGDHITIKDNLNNIKWLDIPYDMKQIISYSLLKSLNIEKDGAYSLSISDSNYKDRYRIGTSLIKNVGKLKDFLKDFTSKVGKEEKTLTSNLPIFIYQDRFIIYNDQANTVKIEDNKIVIEKKEYKVISVYPKLLITRDDKKYRLKNKPDELPNRNSKRRGPKSQILPKIFTHYKDKYDTSLSYELIDIKEGEPLKSDDNVRTSITEYDLYIITYRKGEYNLFSIEKWGWSILYKLVQYRLLGEKKNIENKILKLESSPFVKNKNLITVLDKYCAREKEEDKNMHAFDGFLDKKEITGKLEDNISKFLLRDINQDERYFFGGKWGELSDIVWLDCDKESKRLVIDLFHMKTKPFKKCIDESWQDDKKDYYWEYTEVLGQCVQKLKGFFDIKDSPENKIEPILKNIQKYYPEKKQGNSIYEKCDKLIEINKWEYLQNLTLNICFPIYKKDIAKKDKDWVWKVDKHDEINRSSIYLLHGMLQTNIAWINKNGLKVDVHLIWLLISKEDDNIIVEKLNFETIFW